MKSDQTTNNSIKTLCSEISKVLELIDLEEPNLKKREEDEKKSTETEKIIKKIKSQLLELSK
ncbi:MAG: hypothetical protein KDD50_05215 [Bdellovibrionales bacterium]|nr:hypothetical protein [Bdellovibrionales bacterium]